MDPEQGTIFEAAGGMSAMRRLAAAWHVHAVDDPVVGHAFSHGFRDDHVERLAAYLGEALGGPISYSGFFGDQTEVVRLHSGNGLHPEMNAAAIACFDRAITDAGLADDPELAGALHDYWAWATRVPMQSYPDAAGDVPRDLPLTRWTWEGPVTAPADQQSTGPDVHRGRGDVR
ncbi:globin domain-containing protein [Calidifontibacter terrae]